MTTTRTATGPLVVSARNPRYFTPASGPDAGRAVYLTGSHIWNNLQDGMGPGPEGPDEPERMDYDAYLRFPQRTRPQLHPAVALGAVPVAGRRRKLSPEHEPAAVAAHRAGRREGRQAALRPGAARRRLLPAAARTCRRSRRGRHLRRRHAVRRLGAPPQPCAGPHRGPPVPRRQQRQRHRRRIDQRPAGAAARPARAVDPGGVHPEGRRHPPRPPQRAVGGGQRVLRRRNGHRRVRGVPRPGHGAGLGRLDRMAVPGDRHRQATRASARLRRASHRHDDAVSRRGADRGQRSAARKSRRLDLARLRR